ncbi:MAG: SpoIIE family protein phosphatase [Crocinitomicaceae bacterium]|nr:SpoIIE family protein phosphatase [Crocinitomicaceae bacterium]
MRLRFDHITYLSFLILISCQDKNSSEDQHPNSLTLQPETTELNLDEGYSINYLLDTIQPILLNNGDTVISGQAIPFQGTTKAIEEWVVGPIRNSNFTAVSSTLANNTVPASPIRSPINLNAVITEKASLNQGKYLVIEDDSIHSGTPLKAIQKNLKITLPQSSEALPYVARIDAPLNINSLSREQGLLSDYITSVVEDKQGNVWISSDEGINCFDGNSLVAYTIDNGLSEVYGYELCKDSKENIWISTEKGLLKYNGDTFIEYAIPGIKSGIFIRLITEDEQGNIWLATNQIGACKFDGENFTCYTTNEGLPNNFVQALAADHKGNIWIGTEQGATKFDGTNFTTYNSQAGLNNRIVRAITASKDGKVWIGSTSGLNYIQGDSITIYPNFPFANYGINCLMEDEDGSLWIGTSLGLVELKDGKYSTITQNEGLSNNRINDLNEFENSIWICTNEGINIIDKRSFEYSYSLEGVHDNNIIGISEDKDGNIWIGSDFGACKFDGEVYHLYNKSSGLYTNRVSKVVKDANDHFYFGTHYGIDYFDGDKFLTLRIDESAFSNNIFALIEDSKGNIWASCYAGVWRFKNDSLTHFSEKDGLPNSIVYDIEEDHEGNIWFATMQGLTKFDGQHIINYTEREGLLSNVVFNVKEDKEGNLWIGTVYGLDKFDGQHFTHFTQKNGLCENAIKAIEIDKDGKIWLGTSHGLNVIQKKNSSNYKIFSLHRRDGLKMENVFLNQLLIDSHNKLWVGTLNGLEHMDLNTFELAGSPPEVSLTTLDINESPFDFRNLGDSLNDKISFGEIGSYSNYPSELELEHQLNHLTFHFHAIDWHAPHKIMYSYKLEGLNEHWSKPSEQSKAEYRNLDHGSYKFKVCAIGESGDWSEPVVFSFKIRPPWWYSWWAVVSYIIIGLIILWLLMKWRTIKFEKRQKELETEVANATHEIQQKQIETEHQKFLIEEAHKEITDSITYAKRIQSAILPPQKIVKEYLTKSFILYKPKDIVAGDFYWLEQKDGKILFAAADCTGHGVPGAMVSVICNNGLNRSVREHGITDPGKILDKTRKIVIQEFEKSEEEVKDGMDIALCSLERHPEPVEGQAKASLKYAGAHNPLWIIRNGGAEIEEIKADKQPIGRFAEAKPFTSHRIELNPGDTFYIFSDGFADQFGGEKGKKFKASNFKELLLSVQNESMDRQKELIDEAFEKWRGNLEQLDDVCVIGVRV